MWVFVGLRHCRRDNHQSLRWFAWSDQPKTRHVRQHRHRPIGKGRIGDIDREPNKLDRSVFPSREGPFADCQRDLPARHYSSPAIGFQQNRPSETNGRLVWIRYRREIGHGFLGRRDWSCRNNGCDRIRGDPRRTSVMVLSYATNSRSSGSARSSADTEIRPGARAACRISRPPSGGFSRRCRSPSFI
jgi:hypothetical protein